jgi:hypothetical protein
LIDSYQNIKTGLFGRFQETPVFQTSQIGEAGGLTIVAREQKTQTLIDAFIDQKLHEARASKSFRASANASKARARGTIGTPEESLPECLRPRGIRKAFGLELAFREILAHHASSRYLR